MTDAEYFSHPALSREGLLLLADIAEVFHAVKSGGLEADEVRKVMDELDPASKKQDAFGIGESTHRLIFEPDTVEQRFVIIPPDVLTANGHRRGNAWDEFKAQCEKNNQIPIKDGQMALAKMVAARAKRTMGPLLVPEAQLEMPLFWKEIVVIDDEPYEVECRGKPDYLYVNEDAGLAIIIDLKTCGRTVDEFPANIARFRYWMQIAHYRAAVKSLYGITPRCYFVAASKKLPFRCKLFQLDDHTEAAADERRRELLTEYVVRTNSGDWSDEEQTGIETVAVQVT